MMEIKSNHLSNFFEIFQVIRGVKAQSTKMAFYVWGEEAQG
jgi:hypothetical protein